MARSASLDDIEFDGHGQFLLIAVCRRARSISVQKQFYRQATDIQFSVLKGEGRAMKSDFVEMYHLTGYSTAFLGLLYLP